MLPAPLSAGGRLPCASKVGSGPHRGLKRSIGMGGTASTVLWNIGYDPVVHATQGPAYVDNLSGL
eukprot:6175589-Lingulodinium_polyedra.AAC.1